MMKRRRRKEGSTTGDGSYCSDRIKKGIPLVATGFFLGCLVCSTFYLGFLVELPGAGVHPMAAAASYKTISGSTTTTRRQQQQQFDDNILHDKRILVAIASFDFSQWPHLEDVLDGYADVVYGCSTCSITIVIHTTIPYPISWIDLLNSRYKHLSSSPPSGEEPKFEIQIILAHPSIRLHLVDLHRKLFYDELLNYDLFIYTEDDIRVTSRTIVSYLSETRNFQQQMMMNHNINKNKNNYYQNYNVGIVRYEYNFPSNVIMDDKTRHATQNVTRVYWEHSSHVHPAIPESVDQIIPTTTTTTQKGGGAASRNDNEEILSRYVHMKNHHQGMYLATPDLLQAWKEKESCHFDVVTNRPGRGSQPTEGTQRVWMSSQQLYGSHHCAIQQIIPIDGFTSLTVWHLPNKNYRRVGKFRKRQFSDGTEVFETPPNLLTEMDLHLELYEKFGIKRDDDDEPHTPYRGVVQIMTDEQMDRSQGWGRELLKKLGTEADYYDLVSRRINDFEAYVRRGGVLLKEDFSKRDLVDISPPTV